MVARRALSAPARAIAEGLCIGRRRRATNRGRRTPVDDGHVRKPEGTCPGVVGIPDLLRLEKIRNADDSWACALWLANMTIIDRSSSAPICSPPPTTDTKTLGYGACGSRQSTSCDHSRCKTGTCLRLPRVTSGEACPNPCLHFRAVAH